MQLSLEQIYQLSLAALSGSGASEGQAAPVADSVREAEAEGIRNVGLGYLPIYCEHLRCGKVKGDAVPHMVEAAPAAATGVAELLDPFIARRKASGGAPPVS